MPDEMRPEDHIDDHGGPIVVEPIFEPIDHGSRLWFVCEGCGQRWTAAIDFDEMEVSE